MREIGAWYRGQGICDFIVWAPLVEQMQLLLLSGEHSRGIALRKDGAGYFQARAENVRPGDRYVYQLNGRELPDPASYFQPDDARGPSCIVDHAAFSWHDRGWQGGPWERMIIYEIHIGTFTAEGTFTAAVSRLDALRDLGITAIEIMPVAQVSGARNWGYDGVFPFAVQHSYGGPEGFKKFVDASHQRGLAVILDVVYNHLGPEGNVLEEYMPCVTDSYRTPWGKALNYDGAYSFGVRNYVIQNARYWLRQYHVDGLRLDAVHGIFDGGAKHILRELSERVDDFSREQGRKYYLIAESDLNDRKIILSPGEGGYGIDAQWSDDFHHALHALLTRERAGYYEDFGDRSHLVKALREGFVYAGDYSPHRKRYHGSSAQDIAPDKFVVCAQNHDQVGNRMRGERISRLVSYEALKLAAATVLLSPYIPLLFMGEEYGEEAPFLYFMSFQDPHLVRAIREGRRREFAAFGWQEEAPDPYAEETFARSKLNWRCQEEGAPQTLRAFYKELISLRARVPAFRALRRDGVTVQAPADTPLVIVDRRNGASEARVLLNFDGAPAEMDCIVGSAPWRKTLDSAELRWQGPGPLLPERMSADTRVSMRPHSVAVFEKEGR